MKVLLFQSQISHFTRVLSSNYQLLFTIYWNLPIAISIPEGGGVGCVGDDGSREGGGEGRGWVGSDPPPPSLDNLNFLKQLLVKLPKKIGIGPPSP